MVSTAEHIREKLKKTGRACTLVNGRFIKPVDTDMLDRLAEKHRYIVTLEENVLRGGFGEQVLYYMEERHPGVRVICITLPDAYVEHGDVTLLRSVLGIDSDSIIRKLARELPCLEDLAPDEGGGEE
jgi:1-deoxy-D-xylulose-5-phosphate synthase